MYRKLENGEEILPGDEFKYGDKWRKTGVKVPGLTDRNAYVGVPPFDYEYHRKVQRKSITPGETYKITSPCNLPWPIGTYVSVQGNGINTIKFIKYVDNKCANNNPSWSTKKSYGDELVANEILEIITDVGINPEAVTLFRR